MTTAWQAKRYAMDARAARDALLYLGETPLAAQAWNDLADCWEERHQELTADEEIAAKATQVAHRAAEARRGKRRRIWFVVVVSLALVLAVTVAGLLAWVIVGLASMIGWFGTLLVFLFALLLGAVMG